MPIFASTAPLYWEHEMPAIPLLPGRKNPAINRWPYFNHRMPTAQERQIWLTDFAYGNVGLVLGKQAGIVVLDIDTTDEALQKIIVSAVPRSPWLRVGRKGLMLAFKYSGQKTFRIKTAEGATLCELLSDGAQTVLAPSIHPDTQQPYSENVPLWQVKNELPVLPAEIEAILRNSLRAAGQNLNFETKAIRLTEFVSKGARDVEMTRMAGFQARCVLRGELSLKRAIDDYLGWFRREIEAVPGDPVDGTKGVENIIKFLIRDINSDRGLVLPIGWDDDLTDEDKKSYGLDVLTAENEQWDYTRATSYLIAEFEAHPTEDAPERFAAIEKVLQRLAISSIQDPIVEERIFQFIREQTGRKLTLGTLKKQLRTYRTKKIAGETHSELADRLIEEMEQVSAVGYMVDRIYRWVGSHWSEIDKEHVMADIARDLGHYPGARRRSDHGGIYATMVSKLMRDKTIKPNGGIGINFANGVLTKEMKLIEHDQTFGFDYVIPYSFDANLTGKCPRFLSFLHQCWGKDADYEEKVAALQEAIAVTMFGQATQYQKAFCLKGLAHTGKSVMLEIVAGLMPANMHSNVPPGSWGDKFAPSMMSGKLINIGGDLSEHRLIDGENFKQIVSGNEITAQFKNRPLFEFKPTAAHWFASNHPPKSRDSSEGFIRRWLFLEFNHVVTESEKIVGLADIILHEEREAITAWAVPALTRIVERNGYTLPASHLAIERNVRFENSSLKHFFLEGRKVRNVKERSELANLDEAGWRSLPAIEEKKLHEIYNTFCLMSSTRPYQLRTFRDKMREVEASLGLKVIVDKDENGFEIRHYHNLRVV